jgi:hypothetical protein
MIASGVSVWIVYDTEWAKGSTEAIPKITKPKRIMRTAIASIVFVALAGAVFVGMNSIEKSLSAKATEPSASSGQDQSRTEPSNSHQPQTTNKDASAVVPKETIDTTKSAKRQNPFSAVAKKYSPPKQEPPSPAGVDNSVTVGGDLSQSSQGNCSPNIVGGSSTVNCAPVPSEVSWKGEAITPDNTLANGRTYPGFTVGAMNEEGARVVKQLAQNPGLLITLSPKNSWPTANFALTAKCNRPCFGINARLEGAGGFQPQYSARGGQPRLIFLSPAVVLPTMRVLWEIRSLDSLPIMVGNIELIALQ